MEGQISGKEGNRLIIGVGSTLGPSGPSREMVGHQGCLADSVNCKLQKASFLVKEREKRR